MRASRRRLRVGGRRTHGDMVNADAKRRFKRAVACGRVAMPVGGMRDGALWDGVEYLDGHNPPNLLWWLCGWNEVGVFAENTQRDLRRLFEKHGIELRRCEDSSSPASHLLPRS